MNIKNAVVISLIAVGAVMAAAALSPRFREFLITGGRASAITE